MAVTKEQIADAFEKRVERFGYAKTTIDEVASDLRISKKTVYAHFEGKAEIYRYVVERIARASRSDLRRRISGLPTYREKVLAMVKLVAEVGRSHVGDTERSEWEAQFVVAEEAFKQAFESLLAELVRGGIDAGEFAVRDEEFASRMLGAMVIEYTLMMREDPGYDRDEELLAAIGRFVG